MGRQCQAGYTNEHDRTKGVHVALSRDLFKGVPFPKVFARANCDQYSMLGIPCVLALKIWSSSELSRFPGQCSKPMHAIRPWTTRCYCASPCGRWSCYFFLEHHAQCAVPPPCSPLPRHMLLWVANHENKQCTRGHWHR